MYYIVLGMMNETIISNDTSLEAARVQYGILSKLDIAERAEMTFELCDNMRKFVEAGVRGRHPDYNKEQVHQAVMRLTLGERLFREAFGDIEIEP